MGDRRFTARKDMFDVTHRLACGLAGALLLVAGAAQGRDDFAAPGYAAGAAAYLQAPAHAHAAALAGAVAAWRTGLAGAQFNPALIDGADSAQAAGSYAFLTDGRYFHALDAASPAGEYLAVGLSFVNTGVSGIERRDEFGMLDQTSPTFDDREAALSVAAAGRLQWGVSMGVRLRYLYQRLDDRTAHGVGVDAGATWRPVPLLTIGVSGTSILSRLWWDRTGHADDVSPQARLGVALALLDGDLRMEIDGSRGLRQPLEGMAGVEYTLLNIIALRAGASSSLALAPRSWRDPTVAAGLGLRYGYFGADYALAVPTADPGAMVSHRVSVVFNLPRFGR